MKITAYISRIAVAAVAMLASLSSCNSVIYDDEGDCDVIYRLRFRYDMNMKFADAFNHEVKSVHLYAFDSDDKLVWQTVESGDRLAREDYDIILQLAPGEYKLMAWCGLDNGESFHVPEIDLGDTREQLHCRMNRSTHPEDGTVSTEDLHPLFHGTLDVELPENLDGGEYVYTMPLTKDTNVFRIVLQHLSGEDIEADDFTFKIEDNNGWLHHDNSLRDDENIIYHAWSVYSGSAGVDVPLSVVRCPLSEESENGTTQNAQRKTENGTTQNGKRTTDNGASGATQNCASGATRAITDVKVAVAELTVNRLVQRDWSVNAKPVLVIRKAEDGELVARIPIIDYALLVKGNYNRAMSDQEYLDRQDEYNMTFFLDENNRWLATTIIINSWRVVLNQAEL